MPTPLCDGSRRLLSYPRVFICSPRTMLLSRQSITRSANRDPSTARNPDGMVLESGRCVARTRTMPAAEIGRAACRGRGGQDVWISVVAVALKKQILTQIY